MFVATGYCDCSLFQNGQNWEICSGKQINYKYFTVSCQLSNQSVKDVSSTKK